MKVYNGFTYVKPPADAGSDEMIRKPCLCVDIPTRVGALTLRDDDIVNPDDYDHGHPWGGRGGNKLYLVHNEFGTVGAAFARCEQDAMDEIIDAGKLDADKVSPEDMAEAEADGTAEDFLVGGNAGEAFHGDYIGIVEIPAPAFSLVKLFHDEFTDGR